MCRKNPTEGKTKNSENQAVMPSSPGKEVIAMENEYIICFMIVLLLLVITIKK